MGSFKDLIAYKKSFENAMLIFNLSKTFPKEETYSLTDQIRRSSRSVTVNLIEGYRKRRYLAHFISKLTDADMENSETIGWLQFALACKYVNEETCILIENNCEEVGKLLNYMINNPEKFGVLIKETKTLTKTEN